MYSIKGGEIVVMALHGHVYYSDWQTADGKKPGPFTAIIKDGGAFTHKGNEFGDAEKEKYKDVYFKHVAEWKNPASGSLKDWGTHFLFGTKTTHYLMNAVEPEWFTQIASLIDKIERGEVILSEKMKEDFQVQYLQFE